MKKIAILGSGIAGLSAGFFLKDIEELEFKIFEKSNTYGGLARSFNWHGFECDFATHRFYTTDQDVLSAILSIVPMTRQIRRSKLYILDSWLNDPINPSELIKHIPIKDKLRLFRDLINQKSEVKNANNFSEYVIEKFGQYMFDIFFRPYTEKLFGINSENISVHWAENKVRLINPFRGKKQRNKNNFSYFHYPINGGYGVIADTLYQHIKNNILFNSEVKSIQALETDGYQIEYDHDNSHATYGCDTIISTLPLSLTSNFLGLDLPISFRSVSCVYLWVNKPQVMDYHWVYFIPDEIVINRLVEFKNLNPTNSPTDTTVICAEVTQQGNHIEEDVIRDLIRVGLISKSDILDVKLIRSGFGYPVYEVGTEKLIKNIKDHISTYQNIYLLGRAAEFIHREVDDIFAKAKKVTETIVKQQAGRQPERVFMKNIQVCTIVLTYNNFKDTAECLESLQNLTYQGHKIIVVDNGSSDNSPALLKENFPDITLIALEKNFGVPAGFNKGIQIALNEGFEYVFILNNDTVVAPDMMTELMTVAEKDPHSALLMPKILYYPPNNEAISRKDVWSDGGYYRTFPPGIVHKDNRKNINFDEPRKVDYVPTCGLLIHSRAFNQVGLFDPGYFFFFEDWDFSERVRAANLNIWSVPTAKLWHKVSKSTKVDSELYWQTMGESTIRFFRRHYSLASSLIQISYRILRDLVFSGNIAHWKPFYRGVKSGLNAYLNDYPDISNYMASSNINSTEGNDEF